MRAGRFGGAAVGRGGDGDVDRGLRGHVVDANAISPVTADEVCRIVTEGGAILAESRRATTSSRYSGDGLSASRIPASSA